MKTIDLAYTSYGDKGPPLLILHGLFGAGRNWSSIARRLAERHRVLAVDLRNHGASPHGEMDYPHLAADLVRLLDSRNIDSSAVIGHSLGGKVAVWLAVTAAARVSRLVAVDIAPVCYRHDFNPVLSALRGLPIAEIRSRNQADEWLSESIPESSLRQYLLQNLISEHGHYRWRIDLEIFRRTIPTLLDFPPLDHLAPYPGQTLFIGGSRSRYILPEYHAAITRYCPNHRMETIQDAGHWVHVDQPRRFVEMVNEFLVGV
ncbi:MAG: alpha/beta fold hydrolase [Methylococcales bacterium]